jgi:hypothetical protein
MTHLHHPCRAFLLTIIFSTLAAACGSTTPAGVDTDDVRGTWSGTFADFSLMGRSLSGDVDWTFTRDTFDIIFFDPPEDQAERIEGKWKFADGRIAIELTSSFPIDDDIGAKDTLFVSILRDEMSLKTIAQSSILLIKTRIASSSALQSPTLMTAAPAMLAFNDADAIGKARESSNNWFSFLRSSEFRRADIRQLTRTQHPPI